MLNSQLFFNLKYRNGIFENRRGALYSHSALCVWNEQDCPLRPLSNLQDSIPSFSSFLFLPNFWKENQHFVTKNIAVATKTSRNPITCKEWYWNQVSLWAAGDRCLAPLWYIINSNQRSALSRGFISWSWWILETLGILFVTGRQIQRKKLIYFC